MDARFFLRALLTTGFFCVLFCVTAFGFLSDLSPEPKDFTKRWQLAAVGAADENNWWCDLRALIGWYCESEPEDMYPVVTPMETDIATPVAVPPKPKKLEVAAKVSPSPASSFSAPTVINQYITNPVINQVVREVLVRERSGDTSDFIDVESYSNQVDALLTSIEDSSAGAAEELEASLTALETEVETDLLTAANGNFDQIAVGTTTAHEVFTLDGVAYLASVSAPTTTANRLYNSGSTLYWSGNAIAGTSIGNWDSDGTDVWRAAGNVGIGTTTPDSLLVVAGTANITGATTLGSTLTVTGNTTLVNASTTNLTVSGDAYFGDQLNLTGSSANVALGSNYLSGDGGDEGLFVDSSGNVGIGTTTPGEALTVVGGISSAGEGVANEIYGLGATLISGPGNGNTLVGAYTEMAAAGFGQYNTIVGAYSSSSNAYNTIVGSRSSATGAASVLIGDSLTSSVSYSTIIGANSSVSSDGLIAMGYSAQATHNNAVAIGWGVASQEDYEYVFGSRETASSSPSIRLHGSTNAFTGQDVFELDTEWIDSTNGTRKSRATLSVFDTAERTFMQADATGSGVTTSFNGGNIGIGTTTPASLLAIQTTGTTDILNLFETGGSEVLTVLESGFVGIGESTPLHMLHVKNNASTYAGVAIEGDQVGDATWILLSGFPAAGDFSIRESGVQTSLTVKKTTGNVGIGTTTPGTKLTVAGTTNITGATTLGSTLTVTGNATLTNASTTNLTVSSASYFGGQLNLTGSGANITLGSNYLSGDGGDEGIFVDSSGNVGVGTSGPNDKLDVYGGIRSTDASTGSFGRLISYDLGSGTRPTAIRVSNDGTGGTSDVMTFLSSGNVGIGTTTPGEKLQVAGAIKLTGTTAVHTASSMGVDYYSGEGRLLTWGGTSSTYSPLQMIQITSDGSSSQVPFYISDAGKIGIGTTTPSKKLTVVNDGAGGLLVAGNSSNSVGIDIQNFTTSGRNWSIFSSGGGPSAVGTLGFYDNTAALTRLLVDTSGNVGIGTITPDTKLTVHKTSASAVPTLGTASGSFSLLGDIGLYGLYAGVANTGDTWFQTMRNDSATSYNLLLNPVGGNVGIGTTTPSEILTIGGGGQTGVQSGVSDGIYVNPNGDGAQIAIETNSGVEAGILALDSTGLVYMGSWSNNDLQFRASNVSYMTLTTGGNFGIATTTPGRKLTVAGTVEFRGLTAAVGAGSLCLSSSNEVVYNSGSDNCLSSTRNTKHAITPLTLDAINILNELEPVSFIYNGTDRVRYGFIAENTASVDEILATYNAEGELTGIDDRSILSVLVRAFQEFYREVMDRFTAQDSRIDLLEARIRELEEREGIDHADENDEPADLCPNLSDTQAEVPSGYSLNPDSGECVEDDATSDGGDTTTSPTPVSGCTDSEALNFNADATEDDDSCEYEEPVPSEEEEAPVEIPVEVPAAE